MAGLQGQPAMHLRAETLSVRLDEQHSGVAILQLERPERSNAVTHGMLDELPKALTWCSRIPSLRAVVLHGAGKNFCGGLDLSTLSGVWTSLSEGQRGACPATTRHTFLQQIKSMQEAITALENFQWPVVAAIHGACVGAGVDIVTACDIRVCTSDARLCVKEVDLGITADLGTLQRLAPLVGEGRARELALTARTFSGRDALEYGLVTSCHDSPAECLNAAMTIARGIALKPGMAVLGTKAILLHSRSHSVSEGLDFVALWNSSFLLSHDLDKSFSKLLPSAHNATRAKL